MKIEGVNKETGEYVKPYETPEHLAILKEIGKQTKFVRTNIISDTGESLLTGKSGDVLVEYLVVLLGFYEVLGTWVSNEKLHIAEMKTELELKFANYYCDLKLIDSETNETARMKSKIMCQTEQRELDIAKHALEVIEKNRKFIGRAHDSVRSALSHEKSLAQVTR